MQDILSCGCVTISAVAACAFLPFVPLVLAAFEHFIFGTEHVEDFLRAIQLHELLGELYKPIIDSLRLIFNF